MIEFCLLINLVKDGLQAEITAKRSISEKEFESVKSIICKAKKEAEIKDVDFAPAAKFMKSDEVNYLIKKEWKVNNIDFIVSKEELLKYYNLQRINGGTLKHAHEEMFPYVPISQLQVTNFKLMMDKKIVPCSMPHCRGGYILPKFKDRHEEMLRKNSLDFTKYMKEPKNKKRKTQDPEPILKPKSISLTKAEGKRCRKNIIDKAKMSDICKAGFKPDFVQNLKDTEQAYLSTLSNLQLKLMINAVTKK